MNQKEKMKISKRQMTNNFLGCSTKCVIILQLLCISFVPFCNGYVNVQTLTTTNTRKHAVKVRAETKITKWNKQIYSSSKVMNSLFSRQDDSDDMFNMEMLQSRISQVKERSNKLPLVVLDAMLPRQVLKVNVRNALLMELIRTRLEAEEPFFGMLGTARIRSPSSSSTPQTINLVHGVQVKILTSSSSSEEEDESTQTTKFSDDTFRLHVQATNKRFVIDGDIESTPQGWTEAKVKYLDTKENEEEEEEDEPNEESIQMAKNVLHDNLVNKWVELAEKRERFPGQIDQLLIDLGPMPSSDDPSDLALWIGALINPLPAMGVAMEIRPALLTATTSKDRIQIAHDGIIKSIHHMDGSKPMW